MTSEEEARRQVLEAIGRGPSVSVALIEAAGRWSAGSIVAGVALPGFDNSAMDGYAVHLADCGQTDRLLTVTGEMPAGRPLEGARPVEAPAVSPGCAVRIFTGAPLPPGTGAVVMQEDVVVVAAASEAIRLQQSAVPGEFIRRRGSDVVEGQKLLAAGDIFTAARIGLVASQGQTSVEVIKRPRVAVVTTGDEVVAGGQPLPHDAALYNSNGPMLACLAGTGGAEVATFHAPDDIGAVSEVLAAALENHDMVVFAGGVSVGRYDHVKPALAILGWQPTLWRVAVKPGKPFLFSTRDNRSVFGLPGNPVSAFVTFHLFVAPAIRKWQGAPAAHWPPPTATATLASPLANHGDRPHYLRGTLNNHGSFEPAGLQESHALFGLSRATALVRVPPDTTWEAGQSVVIYPL